MSIYSNGGYVASFMHPFDLFPPSTSGFQMLKIEQCISTNIAGLFLLITVCAVRMGKYSYVIRDVLQGKSCLESRQNCAMASLLGHLGVFPVKSFQSSLKCSYCKSLCFHHLYSPSEYGFGSMV